MTFTAEVRRLGLVGLVGALAVVVSAAVSVRAQGEFSATEMQLFYSYHRQPVDGNVVEMTIEHFSEGKHMDHYFIADIEGQKDYVRQPGTFFFLYKPRLSLDKVLGKKVLPLGFLGETYLCGQYSGSSSPYTRQVWYYGMSVDLAIHPNYGYSNINVFVRDEDTQGLSYHLDYTWDQPFNVGPAKLDCKGWADLWEDDTQRVFFAQPQFRLNMSTFVGPDHVLARGVIGLELQMSHNLYGYHYGWENNPCLFVAYPF